MSRHRVSYGIDAPMVPIWYSAIGCILLVISVVILIGGQEWGFWLLAYGLIALTCATIYMHTTLRGKFLIWRSILSELKLPSNAKVLDMGCGHGMVLIMAAKHLGNDGKAVGVDLWRKVDQSGNDLHATERNADAESVSDKIQLITADMTHLPLEEARFDFVFSSLAIHNINSKEGRRQALLEALRVLKPGGTFVIADIMKTREYMQILQNTSMIKEVKRSNVGWTGWWTGPWVSTHIIKAIKR